MADAQANINVNVNTQQALASIRALQAEISTFQQRMSKINSGASAQAASMQKNLINSINATGKFSAQMTTISSTTESFTNALENNKLKLGEYFRYAGGASKTFGKFFRNEFNTIDKVARERVKTLQTQYVKLGRDANGALRSIAVRPLALDMKNLGTQTQMAAQKVQLFNQLVRQGSTHLLNWGKNTQWAGRQLMVGFTIPLTIFGTMAAREFQKIEEQVIKFRRVYGDMFSTEADTEKALSNVRKLADEFTKYGIAVEKTLDTAAKIAQMGNTGTALEQQLTQATRLSILGGMEQQDALDTTISLTNAFGVSLDDLAGKIDFLNAAENQTILAIQDFNTAIPLAGSVVKQLGGEVEDLAFLLTAMREGGINASQAGNALKSSLGRLIAPSKNARDTLSGFGINVMSIVEKNAGNLTGTIMSLATSLDELDPLSRARAIEALFGKFQFARMSTLLQNVVKEGSQANKVLELTTNTAEELAILSERELGRVEESAATKFQKSMESLKASLAPVGEAFLKVVTPILNWLADLMKRFDNLGDGTKHFITILVTGLGLVAPALLMVIGLVANGVANLIKFFNWWSRIGSGAPRVRELGLQTQYMTQKQLEANAAAAALNQSHTSLRQTFTSEATALQSLTAAYTQATAAQRRFMAVPGRPRPGSGMKLASGIVSVPGPKGAGDVVPAMLSPGEAVIPAKMASKYAPFIRDMISDNIPGFKTGKYSYTGSEKIEDHLIRLRGNDAAAAELERANAAATATEKELLQMRKEGIKVTDKQIAAAKQLDRAHVIDTKGLKGDKGARNAAWGPGAWVTRTGAENNMIANSLQNSERNRKILKEYLQKTGASEKEIAAIMKRNSQGLALTQKQASIQGRALREIGKDWSAGKIPKGKMSQNFGMYARAAGAGQAATDEVVARQSPKAQKEWSQEERRRAQRAVNSYKEEQAASKRNVKATEENTKAKRANTAAKKKSTTAERGGQKATATANKQLAASAKKGRVHTTVDKNGRTMYFRDGKRISNAEGQQAVARSEAARRGAATRAARRGVAPDPAQQATPGRRGPMISRGGVAGAAMMGGMVAGMLPGKAGEVGSKLAGPLLALGMLAMLPPKLAALIAVVGTVVAAFMYFNNAAKNAAKESYELTRAMSGSRQAIQSFAEFSGKVTTTELRERSLRERFNPFSVAAGKSTFGEKFVESDAGKALTESTKKSITDLGRDATVKSLFLQLGQAIGEGALSVEEARSVATQLGNQLGDMSIGMQVNAKLMELVGPGGEDLLAGERLTILAEIREERQAQIQEINFIPVTGMDIRTPESDANQRRQEIVDSKGGGFWGTVNAFFTSGEWHKLSFDIATDAEAARVNMEQLGEILAIGANNADFFAAEMAAIDAAYADPLQKAYAMQDTYEIERLEKERSDAVEAAMDLRRESNETVLRELSKDVSGSRRAMQEALKIEFAEDSEELKDREDIFGQIGKLGIDEPKQLELQFMLTSGDMPLSTIRAIIDNFDERPEISSKIMDIQTRFGGEFSGSAAELYNMFKGLDEILAEKFVISLDTSDLDKYQKQIDGFAAVNAVSALFPEGEEILLKYVLENPEALDDINERIRQLDGVDGDQITLDFVANTFGEEALAAAKAIWDDIDPEDRKTALYSILTSLDLELSDGFNDIFNSLKGQTIAGVTIDEPGDILAMIGSRGARIAGGNRGLAGDDPEPESGGGGSKPEAFDPLLKKLRDLRIATIDMKRGWDGMMESLEKVFEGGTKTINVFDGLANQIRRFGVGENLIQMIVGMDPDEYEKRKNELFVFDKDGNIAGTTAKLKNLNAAFNAVALGEYVNQQQASLQSMRDQISAISILTANGLSLADAYELVQNEALAAAIAMGATREEIREIIRLTKQIKGLREKMQKEDEKAQASKAVRKTNEEFERRVAVLNKLARERGRFDDDQINAIFSDPNLQILYLNPRVDQRALDQALANVRRQAQIEMRIKVMTEEGKKNLFDEYIGEINDEFSRQEAKIEIEVGLETKADRQALAAVEDQIARLQYELDDYQAEITRIADQEKDINDAYDKRFEALDKVAQQNERIAAAQKSQLDVADALSRGDIAAAARAAKEARAQASSDASKTERQRLEDARDAQLRSLTGRTGLNREQLEEKIRRLEMQIFDIEEDELEPVQERLRIADYEKSLRIDALTVSGKTRTEWDQIANLTDIATQNAEEFAKNVERALALYEHFVNGAPLDLSLFGGELEAALEAMGVNVKREKTLRAAQDLATSIDFSREGTSLTAVQKKALEIQELNNQLVKSRNLLDNKETAAAESKRLADAAGVNKNTTADRAEVMIRQQMEKERQALIAQQRVATQDFANMVGATSPDRLDRAFNQAVTSAGGTTRIGVPIPAPAPAPAPQGSGRPLPKQQNQQKIPSPSVPFQPLPAPAPVKTGPVTLTPTQRAHQEAIRQARAAGARATGGLIPKRFAIGGKVEMVKFAPRGSDTVPAMLTPGEFVIRRPAVRDFGLDNLEKINRGSYTGGSMYNYNLTLNVKSDSDPSRIARTVIREIKRIDAQRVRGNRF